MPIPRSKYSEPRHTPGKEYTLNGQEYRGWYVETYQGKFYTGKSIDSSSKELFPIEEKKPTVDPFTEELLSPTQTDRDNGYWNRYVLQKIDNRKIIEVNKEKFDLLNPKSQYRGVIVNWIIKGPAENRFYNSYIYYGADHRNRETVSKLENSIPGITNFFRDYSEFVE